MRLRRCSVITCDATACLLTLVQSLEVVAVSLTAAVHKVATALLTRIVEELGEGSSARSHYYWLPTDD